MELPPPLPGSPRRDLCPFCKSEQLHRSRRRWWEKLIGKTPIYRCSDCRRRFPRERVLREQTPEKP